ncbi:hypothetical protein IE4872_CH01894 [Rhizobium gallicum]|uniref:Uncharacterized protein n=1 Tax=Rhizobium gallicum TaxID=56730 RepID=A0A1L5NHV9_9HYPH|nr:hypothetical protein IE4872_CH01894 [Rhizobium gallicum]
MEWGKGDEDIPPTFVLKHAEASGAGNALAYNTFEAVRNDWWRFLADAGIASGPQYSPEFMQNKLRRIFGGGDTFLNSERT